MLAGATVAAIAGIVGVVVIEHPTLRAGDPAPRIVPGSKTVLDQRIVKGTSLPADTALVDVTVRLPPVKRTTATTVRLTCPRGHLAVAFVPKEDTHDPAFRGAASSIRISPTTAASSTSRSTGGRRHRHER